MAAVMLQVIRSFYTKFSKNSRINSANTYEKNIVSKKYNIFRHDEKVCFLPNCRCHIILLGNHKQMLQKLDAFCFKNQHVDCLYNFFKYRFAGKTVIKSEKLFENVQRALQFNHQNRGGQNAQHREKEALEEKVQKTFVELLPKRHIDAN